METKVQNANQPSTVFGSRRKVLMMYGQYYAQQLFTVRTTNPDLKYKEDVMNGKNTLRYPVSAFVVEPVDISSIEFLEKDVDGNPKVIFNSKSKNPLVFPVEPPQFCKATRETIADCIEALQKNNAKPMFFAAQDLDALIDIVNNMNQTSLDFYNEMSRKCLRLSETLSGMMDANTRVKNSYYAQCGIVEDEIELRANVTVE